MDEIEEIRHTFIAEVEDLIDRIRRQLDGFVQSPDRKERLTDILRAIHTIKGGAGTCGFMGLQKSAHELESKLMRAGEKIEAFGPKAIAQVTRAIDHFEELLTSDAPPEEAPKADVGFGFFDEPQAPAVPAPVAKAPVKAGEVREEDLQGRAAMKGPVETLRVPVERVQKNIDVISEIFLLRNQMRYLVEQKQATEEGGGDFFQRWEALDNALRKGIGELEAIAMSMRMTPVKSLLKRMDKVVRDYAERVPDKKIRIEVEGDETEIDKKILDSLGEPLIHLTRNAMDHGIESAAERLASGKPAEAVIRFRVAMAGNEVELSVEDNGRGIDEQKILASATRKGLDVSHARTKSEMLDLIFMPGFSTAEKVTDVSGRGIGMDAVRSYVENLGGSITLATKVGAGSTFTMRLPLGMSVIPVILARIGGRKMAIANTDVVETLEVPREAVVSTGGRTYVKRAGEFIPCIDVAAWICAPQTQGDAAPAVFDPLRSRKTVSLCIVSTGGRLVAMRVDELLANAELAVKPAPELAPSFSYASGVSILATGEPTFVIVLGRLYEKVIRPQIARRESEVGDVAA